MPRLQSSWSGVTVQASDVTAARLNGSQFTAVEDTSSSDDGKPATKSRRSSK